MMTIVSYDVSTVDKLGRSRLRKVAKICQNYGQRVQNSVFEIFLDYAGFLKVKSELLKVIDDKADSLRFYYLGEKWDKRVEHFGIKDSYNPEGPLIV
ncbi:MAG: CRISPR-associated endonuclease Cas2 [Clostridiaceae bacterium]|nr:CRISPR-associated endonuclease Cas2 [Clostridiaceae bacterium]